MKKTLLRLVLPLLLVVMMVTPMMSAFAEVTPAKEPITFTMFIAGPGEAPAKDNKIIKKVVTGEDEEEEEHGCTGSCSSCGGGGSSSF